LNRISILCISLFVLIWTWRNYVPSEQTPSEQAPSEQAAFFSQGSVAQHSQADIAQTTADQTKVDQTKADQTATGQTQASTGDALLAQAFAQHQSRLQVQGEGEVIKLLADDTQGSRHQRFIIRLASGQTLLIAHNIDLAPRLSPLAPGDWVSFYGEYEWNAKGGLVHWTHYDPKGVHIDGWLKLTGD